MMPCKTKEKQESTKTAKLACDICNITVSDESSFLRHLSGTKHAKRAAKLDSNEATRPQPTKHKPQDDADDNWEPHWEVDFLDDHPHCIPCKQVFRTEDRLKNHLSTKDHATHQWAFQQGRNQGYDDGCYDTAAYLRYTLSLSPIALLESVSQPLPSSTLPNPSPAEPDAPSPQKSPSRSTSPHEANSAAFQQPEETSKEISKRDDGSSRLEDASKLKKHLHERMVRTAAEALDPETLMKSTPSTSALRSSLTRFNIRPSQRRRWNEFVEAVRDGTWNRCAQQLWELEWKEKQHKPLVNPTWENEEESKEADEDEDDDEDEHEENWFDYLSDGYDYYDDDEEGSAEEGEEW
eukprot:GILI01003029.1.p1 GENE.GILI01003029.1~~GILI01003029.1.p1  ORF type:complete len:351 (-),score=67.69 GILI01003029.1:81-1133(-)